MKLLTGNDLGTGAVVWWDGTGWTHDVAKAVDADGEAEDILAREEAARRVNSSYIVEADAAPDGTPRPGHIKDRIRALGPTVRSDLTLKPGNAAAIEQVI